MPRQGVAKSTLYNGPVSDAALAVVHDVVVKARDAAFTPMPLDYTRGDVRGELRPLMRQDIRRIDWSADTAEEVARKIHASDGSPGALCTLAVEEVDAYDAGARGEVSGCPPGHIVARRGGAILVATADEGSIWIGHSRRRADPKLLPAGLLEGVEQVGERRVRRIQWGQVKPRPTRWQNSRSRGSVARRGIGCRSPGRCRS